LIARFGILLYFSILWSHCFAGTKPDSLTITNRELYPVNEHLYWLKTKDKITADAAYHLLMNGAGERLAPQHSLNARFDNDYYWTLFTLKNPGSDDADLFYQFNNPTINHIEVYTVVDGAIQHRISTGALLPFKTRGYSYHDFVIPIKIRSNQNITYLIMSEKRGELFSITPALMSTNYFKEKEANVYLVLGIIIGIMIFNILINLFLGISLNYKLHYLYALYVSVTLLWIFGSVKMDYQLLFPDYPLLFKISQPLTGGITMILMAQLAIVFLQLKKSGAKVFVILNTAKWVLITILPFRIALYLVFPKYAWLGEKASIVYLAAIAGIAISMVWAAIVRIRQGFKPAWFYLAAIAYLAFSIFKTCYTVLYKVDVSELLSVPSDIQQGIIVETIIIFIGIIYRYNLYKKEKEELNNKLAKQRIEMTNRIVIAQEEERKRIAQDLHDDVGATLSTLLLHITNLPDKPEWQTPFAVQHNQRSITISRKALTDLRNISHDLLPKDFNTLGFFEVLQNRIEEINTLNTTRFWLSTEGNDHLLNEMQAITLYRITNELVNNIVKHARAAHANIDVVVMAPSVTILVEDDGIGFEDTTAKNGIGIKNVYSRVAFLNGNINIDKNKQGTTIIVTAPI
jgi:signal transduction histidine kinase